MKCECDGSGWFLQANHYHEIMEWVECMPCLVEQKEKQDLLASIAQLISQSSHQKLAKLLADFCMANFDDKDRLEKMVESKDFISLMSFIEVNLK
tara:strand:+ start:77 stop:361 length:285 start_codon:yes stop_codon:yes gene_type:complete